MFVACRIIIVICILMSLKIKAQAEESVLKKIVMITQIVEHPALTTVRKNIIESLKKHGYDSSLNIDLYYENAQGNFATSTQIAQKIAGSHPDVVIAISTPSAQAMVAHARGQFPIVFAAVTDPVTAKLVKSMDKPGVPVTGVVDRAPFEKQLEFIKKILKEKKRLGVIYCSGESNSIAALKILKDQTLLLDLEIIESNALKSADVSEAALSLVHKVDAVYIPNDNTVVSSLDAVVKICNEAHIPLFAADIMLVEKGVWAVDGLDYADMGIKAGELAARILKGKKAENIAIVQPTKTVLYINQKAATAGSFDFPPEIIARAEKIFN